MQHSRKTLYKANETSDRLIVEAVADIAASRTVSRAQIALAWLLGRPGVTAPIVGASKSQHLEDAVSALSIELTAAEMTALETPYTARTNAGFK